MINKDLLKDVAKKIDSMIDWPKITGKAVLGNVLEIADNYVLPYGLQFLNEKYGSKVPDRFIDEIELALSCFVQDDYQGILDSLPEGLDDLIDIKPFEDDFEALWLATNFNATIKVIKFYAAKKAAA